MTPLASAVILDILCALAAHRWFNQHEPSASCSLLPLFTVPLLPAFLIHHTRSFQFTILVAYVVFFMALFTSIVVYRLSPFHPLAKYPGPIACKISQLWTVLISSGGKSHHYRKQLHDRYGSIVRIGPNELSVTDKDMFPYIFGPQGMPRGPLFEGRQMTPVSKEQMENLCLISTRCPKRHAALRKAWNRAFANSPLRGYEELMLSRARQLIGTLETICKEQGGFACLDIAIWIGYFSFDFMGDMAMWSSFGGGFELMRDGDSTKLLSGISRSLYYGSLCQAVPWFSPVLRNLPYFGAPMRAFGSFSLQRAKIRSNQEPSKKDLFYHMTSAYQADSQEASFQLIVSNSILAIIGGADTASTVLRNTVFYLLANPAYYARLREEVDAVFPPTESSALNTEILVNLPILNAVINEVLRLQPPIPTTLQRAPARGTGGKMIGTQYGLVKLTVDESHTLPSYIREGTQIQVSPYVVHRDPRYFFPRPDEFWPDRWILDTLDSQELVLDRSVFIPFSMGPANCVGKPLAMIELRTVVSLFIMHFDMEFDDNFDPQTWMESLKDYYLIESGKLMVKLRVRNRKGVE